MAQGTSQLAANLQAQGMRGQHFGTGGTGSFRHRQGGRHHGRAGVPAQARQAVIEIQGMRTHAIDEGRIGR